MSADISEYSHDHVILVLDTPDFENPPAWLSDNFTIIEGGVHAGGSTRNKLIIFADGTYIELLNWIGEPQEFFDWAGKPAGLIDFALTSQHQSAQETHAAVTKRLDSATSGDGGLGVRFKQPLAGGRKRKDGQHVAWHVTKPAFDNDSDHAPNIPRPIDRYFPTGRLDVPFFCHDVTDRLLRVPYKEDPSITTHPSGAKGIVSVDVLVPESHFANYATLYASVTGARPVFGSAGQDRDGHGYGHGHGKQSRQEPSKSAVFHLRLPTDDEPVPGLKAHVGIEVYTPRDNEDEDWLRRRGIGIRKVRLLVAADEKETEKGESLASAAPLPLHSEGIGASLLLVYGGAA